MSNWFEQMFPGCSMEIRMTEAGNYLLFASPGMTLEDVVRGLPATHPVNGGRPNPGTKADRRLKENKTAKPAPKPATMPAKKGK